MNHSALTAYLKFQPFPLTLLRSLEAGFYPSKLKGLSLDVGCGDGFFANYTFGGKGIDIGVEVNIKTAKIAQTSRSYSQVIAFDGVKLPFLARTFSSVVSNSVLEHVDNPDGLIEEIGRVTKASGLFYLTVPTVNFRTCLLGAKVFHNVYSDFMDIVTRQKYYWTAEKWSRVLEKAGFRIINHSTYFGEKQMAWFDLAHWLSIPSILTKIIFHRWVLFNSSGFKVKFGEKLIRLILTNDKPPHSFQFFACRKIAA